MSYDERETGINSGSPLEFYEFATTDQTWRLTSADIDLTLDGDTYTSIALSRSEISDDQEQRRGKVNVMIDPNHEIAGLFVAYMPSTPLFLTIRRNHDGEADAAVVVIFNGRVNQAIFGDPLTLLCVPDTDDLKKQIPAGTFQTQCNHILYDKGCKIDPEDFKRSATILTVSADGLTLTADAFGDETANWFQNGYIQKGLQRRMILTHSGDTVTLIAPLNGLQAGDAIFAFAGCDRDFNGDCVNKFDNATNYQGFKWVPNRNPFSSSISQAAS